MAHLEAKTTQKRCKIRESELGGLEGGVFRVLLGVDELKTAGQEATIYAIANAFGDVSPKRIQHQIEKLVQLGLVTVERRRQGAFPNHLTPEGVAHLDEYVEIYWHRSGYWEARRAPAIAAAKKLIALLFRKAIRAKYVRASARPKSN